MKTIIAISIFNAAAAIAFGQANTSLPADINATTLTRLPPVQRQDLDADGQKIFDSLAGPNNKGPLRRDSRAREFTIPNSRRRCTYCTIP